MADKLVEARKRTDEACDGAFEGGDEFIAALTALRDELRALGERVEAINDRAHRPLAPTAWTPTKRRAAAKKGARSRRRREKMKP